MNLFFEKISIGKRVNCIHIIMSDETGDFLEVGITSTISIESKPVSASMSAPMSIADLLMAAKIGAIGKLKEHTNIMFANLNNYVDTSATYISRMVFISSDFTQNMAKIIDLVTAGEQIILFAESHQSFDSETMSKMVEFNNIINQLKNINFNSTPDD